MQSHKNRKVFIGFVAFDIMPRNSALEKEKRHSKGLDYIMQNPSSIGLDNIISGTKEFSFFKRKGYLEAEPDLILTDGFSLYLIEYKGSKNHFGRAKNQLEKAKNWLQRKGIDKNKIYTISVHGPPGKFEVYHYTY